MRMRFGSADAMPSAPRSVSRTPCSGVLAGRIASLKFPSPRTLTIAPTELRAEVHKLSAADGLQLTISCCGTMTCGRPSMTCVVAVTARAGPASARATATGTRTLGRERIVGVHEQCAGQLLHPPEFTWLEVAWDALRGARTPRGQGCR